MTYEFRLINFGTDSYQSQGFFKPEFKYRDNKKYASDRGNDYEKQLLLKLFSNNDPVVITKNKYPYVYSEIKNQYVIWVNPSMNVSIKTISEEIAKYIKNKDFILYLNSYHNRSIKTIIHYHLMTKPLNLIPALLVKMIILTRHANRYPIVHFDIFHNKHIKDNDSGLLTQRGKDNSIQFGKNIKKIYDLKNNSYTFLSSPYQRCIDTIKGIKVGLKVNVKTIIKDYLKFRVSKEIISDTNNIIKKLFSNNKDLINKIENKFGVSIKNNVYKLKEISSSVTSYQDQNIDILKIANCDNKLYDEIVNLIEYVYFEYTKILTKKVNNMIINIINDLHRYDTDVVIAASHDHLIYAAACMLANINNFSSVLPTPLYLSNIRFEIWNDGIMRTYYDNIYLGNKK
jgi:NADPH-dependent 7-cyano-7-deazaguanine reductase QueF-like protein